MHNTSLHGVEKETRCEPSRRVLFCAEPRASFGGAAVAQAGRPCTTFAPPPKQLTAARARQVRRKKRAGAASDCRSPPSEGQQMALGRYRRAKAPAHAETSKPCAAGMRADCKRWPMSWRGEAREVQLQQDTLIGKGCYGLHGGPFRRCSPSELVLHGSSQWGV